MNERSMYDGCTLYDMVEKYDYTMGEILGEYPVWVSTGASTLRDTINGYLYDYFANREIASETPEQFARYAQLRMRRTMLKLLPIAAKFWDGSALADDWELSGSTTSTSEASGNATSKATALQSDTPQVQLSGYENYMSGLSESGSESDTTSDETVDTSVKSGNLGARASAWFMQAPDLIGLMQDGLEPLFMQVW